MAAIGVRGSKPKPAAQPKSPGAALPQQDYLRRRMPIVVIGMVLFSVYLLYELVSFQMLSPEVMAYMGQQRDINYIRTFEQAAARGSIYDRNGYPFAVNSLEYEIGISPNLVSEPRATAVELATLLGISEAEIYDLITQDTSWVLLARGVSAEIGQRAAEANIDGLRVNPLPRRFYPQGPLAGQIVGFVAGDGETRRGYNGVEGYYEQQLAGTTRETEVSTIPFDVPQALEPDQGVNLVLTIDRDVQFLAESELNEAITNTGAVGGSIIVMDPRDGAILAMASYPTYDPNLYYEVTDPAVLQNPAISAQYEPGSIIKVLTAAIALDQGVIEPDFAYYDDYVLEFGGIDVYNWDRQAHGLVDLRSMLVQSLNVGAATISTQYIGVEGFYAGMERFGIGRVTGIDLEGEAGGQMWLPGDPNWSESNLATNAYGQGMAMTPLQVLTSVSALANDGLMMQPHVIHQTIDGTTVTTAQPVALGRAVSAEAANTVLDMMVSVVDVGLDSQAELPGYTIAGKTGTAEIPEPGVGYLTGVYNMTFVGCLPADEPTACVLIFLERPTSGIFASQVAAPVFRDFAERLVVLLEIPTDDVRLLLQEQGGSVTNIDN